MNTIIKAVLVLGVFAASFVLGYYLAEVVTFDKNFDEKVVAEQVVEQEVPASFEATLDTLAAASDSIETDVADSIVIEEAEPVAPVVYRKFSREEMEEFLNSGDYVQNLPRDSKSIFSQSMKLSVLNIRADERGVSTLAQVCDKIANGFWNGVKVNNIVYDSVNNQILKVELIAVYPDETN